LAERQNFNGNKGSVQREKLTLRQRKGTMTTWEVSLFQFEAKTEDSKHLGASLYRILQGRNSSWGIRDETTPGSPQQHHTSTTSKTKLYELGAHSIANKHSNQSQAKDLVHPTN